MSMKLRNFLTLVVLAACKSPNRIPEDVLGVDKMKVIVWDLTRADALAKERYYDDTVKLKAEATGLFNRVFGFHGITKEEFYHSYNFYKDHPQFNQRLMDSVTSYANKRRDSLFRDYR